MGNNVFRFKKFEISQEKSAMKVGTDGVLLGAWCDVNGVRKVLDVGTGTGLIAMMVAQRNHCAEIKAVDISEEAVEEAERNFRNCDWANRLTAVQCDFTAFETEDKFDLVVSNPPFFITGHTAEDAERAMARHASSLPFEKLFEKVSQILDEKGTFAIITPYTIKEYVEFVAGDADLWLKRQVLVHTKVGKSPKRILWEYVKYPTEPEYDDLEIRDAQNCFSPKYVNLTSDFYLDF